MRAVPRTYNRPAVTAATWAAPALVAVAAGALYVHSASPAVGGGNTGEFQVMAPLLGIAHPPSYPLYLLLAKLASLVPAGGGDAWRINVLTALFAAAAVFLVGVVAQEIDHTPARALTGALAAAAVAAMPRLWTLAVEAEVFSLHLFLVAAFWLVLLVWQRDRSDRWLLVAALLAGLGLANHRTFLFIAASGALTVVLLRPGVTLRARLLLGCALLCGIGLLPYVYVLRGLVTPVAYFSPADVHRLSRGEAWYVLQGNASGETGGGAIVRDLIADPAQLRLRTVWLWRNLAGQFGVWGEALAAAGAAGYLLVLWRRPAWAAGALLGSGAAAVFAMSYGKYPDADRYLLPLESLQALGLAALAGAGLTRLSGWLRRPVLPSRVAGAACGLALGAYWSFALGVLAGGTSFTRGGYDYFTVFNLEGVEPHAVVCTWWAAAWGWWYAQYVDGHRPDVDVVSKGPDDCVRDVLPAQFGRRPVYIPALTDRVRASDFVFFPSRDLWLAVARRAPLVDGALLKGPDERIFLYSGDERRWVPSMDAFTRHGFSWDSVQLTPDYILNRIPEGPPLE